jgi:hypothetical protein
MDDLGLSGSRRKRIEKKNRVAVHAYKFFLAALANLYDNRPNPDDFPLSEEMGYEVFDRLEAGVMAIWGGGAAVIRRRVKSRPCLPCKYTTPVSASAGLRPSTRD